MTEPKWWPKGKLPTEAGRYFSVYEAGAAYWDLPMKELHPTPERQFYGPIPNPPKDSPEMRPFKATHMGLGRVSGVFVPERAGCYQYHLFFWEGGKMCDGWYTLGVLSDIQWLDKE